MSSNPSENGPKPIEGTDVPKQPESQESFETRIKNEVRDRIAKNDGQIVKLDRYPGTTAKAVEMGLLQHPPTRTYIETSDHPELKSGLSEVEISTRNLVAEATKTAA